MVRPRPMGMWQCRIRTPDLDESQSAPSPAEARALCVCAAMMRLAGGGLAFCTFEEALAHLVDRAMPDSGAVGPRA